MKIVYIVFFALIVSCNNTHQQTNESSADTQVTKKNPASEFTILPMENPDASWGYQLFKDGKMIIDQKNIPAIQGNRGFSTKEKAETIGKFILEKVKNGGFPPTVSIDEMDSLGVLN